RLLTTTAGLEHFLATLNYSCHLLTFAHARSPSRAKLTHLVSRLSVLFLSRPLSRLFPPGPLTKELPHLPAALPSNLARLTSLLTYTRTTLRLTGLLPLYAWLHTLVAPHVIRQQQQQQQQSTHERDPYVHAIELGQCLAYIIYQALENVAHLTDL